MASSKVVDLRKLLAERFPQTPTRPQARIATGVPQLDEATGGGLVQGAITELTSPNVSAGSALLVYRLLQAAHSERRFLALVDGRDSFHPEPLGNARLRNLLWIRCRKTLDAVKAADLLLRDGNFPLVVLDLVVNAADELRKIPQTSWYRLQRLVEAVPTAFLVLTRRSMIGSAQAKLVLENQWHLQHLQEQNSVERLQIRVQRVQGGRQDVREVG